MTQQVPVSAALIVLNEEQKIARCLRSLTWADEIVVIDAQSTDQTKNICEDPQAPWAGKIKFKTYAWEGFRTQRNRMLAEASHDWVLVMDADEECSPELAKKIRELLDQPSPPPYSAYKVQRLEYFLGKQIKGGIWNPSYQDRFFLRNGVQYVNEIHEYPHFLSPPGVIHEPIHHDPHFSTQRFLSKMNTYTTIEAKARYEQGFRTNLFHLFFAFIAMFYKNFIYYRAYQDGMHGFIISLLEGVSRVVRQVKIWELQQKEKMKTK